ncbi:RDD family protein [Microbacterium sp. YY-01]|uniref:RDD family protein n=1 Tax=Microbacterium sp. YY-01 TaxID=3421634 RepID=UPI003D16F64A
MSSSDQPEVASLGRRAGAYLIDAAIGGVLVLVTLFIGTAVTAADASSRYLSESDAIGFLVSMMVTWAVAGLVSITWTLVMTAMQGGAGSVGMRLLGIRLVHADTGGRIGFGRALLRNIIFGLAAAIVVGYFTPLFDGSGRSQGWHDKAVHALMVTAVRAKPKTAVPDATVVAPSAAPGIAPPMTPPPIPVPPVAPFAAAAPTPAPFAAPPPAYSGPQHAQPQEAALTHTPAPTPDVPPAPAATPEPAHAPEATPDPAPISDEAEIITIVPGFARAEPVQQASMPAPMTGPEQAAQHPDSAGGTPAGPATAQSEPAAVSEPAVVTPAPTDASDDDDLESTRISVPGHRLLFLWDDGTRVSVSRLTIFGRNPVSEPGAVSVAVRDETLSLSKTHFEAEGEATGGWVKDRNSTNGMTIVRDGVRIACPPGERVRVRLGDAIEIGERIVTVGGWA